MLYALDEQVRRRKAEGLVGMYEGWDFLGPVLDDAGRCRGAVAQNLVTMQIRVVQSGRRGRRLGWLRFVVRSQHDVDGLQRLRGEPLRAGRRASTPTVSSSRSTRPRSPARISVA